MTEQGIGPETRLVEWSSVEEAFAGAGDVGSGGVLLLGNGFSMNIWSTFGYHTLLERSGLTGTARRLFGNRSNFESVLAEVSTAQKVLGAAVPHEAYLMAQLDELAKEVRDALLETVSEVHPEVSQLMATQNPRNGTRLVRLPIDVLDQLAKYLQRYSKTFLTNYDLISYWVAVRAGIADLFAGSEPFDEAQAARWLSMSAPPKVFFLHGALHLWRSLATNAEGKHTASPDTPLLDVIRASVEDPQRVPLFISEGTSEEKVARISASPYLSFCTRALFNADAPITVLGHALVDVDRHIREAIERHPDRKVAVGVWVGEVDHTVRQESLLIQAREIRGRLSKCHDVVFFDSAEHPLTSPTLHCG